VSLWIFRAPLSVNSIQQPPLKKEWFEKSKKNNITILKWVFVLFTDSFFSGSASAFLLVAFRMGSKL
jgi:hypothetical protein